MSTDHRVQFEICPRTNLTAVQKREMFQLLTQHFAGVTPDQFARDLAEKNLALLLRCDETLAGFSTMLSHTTTFEGNNVNVIYSGDTIVTPEAWGTTALPRAWVAGVDALRTSMPPGPCYWLLLTSGFRTYRFLPVFWREFFPRFDCETPAKTLRLLKQLARDRFGRQFDAERGIVRFEHPQKLKGDLNHVSVGRENDPHVAFFLSNNPGCIAGDELVCLTQLCPENLTAAGRRMMRPQTCATLCDHR
jgi:hypothetical protein